MSTNSEGKTNNTFDRNTLHGWIHGYMDPRICGRGYVEYERVCPIFIRSFVRHCKQAHVHVDRSTLVLASQVF